MTTGDAVVLMLVLIWLILVIYFAVRRHRKSGHYFNCGGNCQGCNQCSHPDCKNKHTKNQD